MTAKVIIFSSTAIIAFGIALNPKLIILEKTGRPHPNQLLARICFAALSLLAILLCFIW
jgi:hypothetical protein